MSLAEADKYTGAFHSTKNSGLNFRNVRVSNGTVFSTRPDRSCSIGHFRYIKIQLDSEA